MLEVECALLAIVMCLVSSHANTYYFIFALPALSFGIVTVERHPERATPRRALVGSCDRPVGLSGADEGRRVRGRQRGVLVARVPASVVIAGVWSHPGGRAHGGAA